MSGPVLCTVLLIVALIACAALGYVRPGSRAEFWSSVIVLAAITAVPLAAAFGRWP